LAETVGMTKIEKELAELKEQFTVLETKNQELLGQLQEGERVRAELSMVVWQKEERIKALQADIEKYVGEMSSLGKSLEDYKQKLKQKEPIIKGQEEKISLLQGTVTMLQEKVEELEGIINQYPVKLTMKIKESIGKIFPLFKKK